MVFVTDRTDPDRDRDTPVPLTGDTPVACLFDPVMEPGGSCPVGVPGDVVCDLGEHFVADVLCFEEPLGCCPVDDRRLASPAVTVAVGDLAFGKHCRAEGFDYFVVGLFVLDVESCEDSCLLGEVAVAVHGADDREVFAETDEIVVPAVAGCDVYHSGVFHGDVVCSYDAVFDLFLKGNLGFKRGGVFCSDEFCAGFCFQYRVVLIFSVFEDLFGEVFGNPEVFGFSVLYCPDFGVYEVFADGYGDVCGKGPGRGCPDDEVFVVAADDGELDEDGRVGFVPVLDFGVSYGGAAAGTPVDDTAAAFEHVFFFAAFEGVPGSFDVAGVNGLIGVVEVHPDAEVFELVAHQVFVGEGELAAFFDEVCDAVFFDVGFVFESEFFLDFDLDGEAVHVVSGTFHDVFAGHGVVAEDAVFEDFVPGGA